MRRVAAKSAGRNLSFEAKAALIASGLFVLFVAALAIAALRYFEAEFRRSLYAQQFSLVSALANSIDEKLAVMQDMLIAGAANIPPDAFADPERGQRFLSQRPVLSTAFDNGLRLVSLEGKIVAEVPFKAGRRERDVSFREFFQKTVATRKPYISQPYVSAYSPGQPAVVMTAPVFDGNGSMVGMFDGSVALLGKNILAALANVKVGVDGYLCLSDSEGTVILHPDKSRIMSKTAIAGEAELYARALQGFEGSGESVDSAGTPMIVTFKRVSSTGWILAANYPADEAYAPFRQAVRYFVIAVAMGSLLLLAAVWATMHRMTAPLLDFIRHVERLPEKLRPERFAGSERADEAGRLIRAFNHLVDALSANERALRESESKFRATFDQASRFIGLLTVDGKVLQANRAALEAVGVGPEEVTGKLFWETPWWSHSTQLQAQLRDAIGRAAGGELVRFEATHPGQHGRLRYVDFLIKPVVGADGAIAMLMPEGREITDFKLIQEALRQREARLREAQRIAHVGSWELEFPGNALLWSEEIYRIFEIDPTRFGASYEAFLEAVHPADRPLVARAFSESVANRTTYDVVHRLLLPDGRIKFVHERGQTFYAADGTPTRAIGTVQDITAARETSEQLRQNEMQLRLIMDNVPVQIAFYDADLVCRFCNKYYAHFRDLTPDQVMGKHLREVTTEEGYRDVMPHVEKVFAGNATQYLGRRPDKVKGTSILEIVLVPCAAEDGGVSGMFLMLHDITERMRVQEQLHLVTDNVPAMIAFYDAGLICRFSNSAYAQFRQLTPEQAAGRHLRELISDDVYGEVRSRYEQALTGRTVRFGRHGIDKLHRERIFEATLVPHVGQDGNVYGVITMLIDVTEHKRTEQRLRESEQRFRDLAEMSSDWFWEQDNELRFTEMSGGLTTRAKLAAERTLGKLRWELPSEGVGEAQWNDHKRLLAARQPFEMTYQIRNDQGELRWFYVKGRPLFAEDGRFCGYRGTGNDFTERKEAENRLRESEAQLRLVTDNVPAMIAFYDGGLYCRFCNRSYARLFGWTPEQAVGRYIREVKGEEVYREVLPYFQTVLAGQPARYAGERAGRHVEVELVPYVAPDGAVQGCFVLIGDVTERRHAEAQLRQSEEKFSTIFHRSPLALAVTRLDDGYYIDVNEAWLRLFGYSRDEVFGHTAIDLGIYENAADRQRLSERLAVEPYLVDCEVWFRARGGRRLLCQLALRSFEIDGAKYLISSVVDISEQRRTQNQIHEINETLEQRVRKRTAELERALETLKRAQKELVRTEKLAALGSLVAGVAHELNTPIGNAVTVASTLQEKVQDFAGEIGNGTVRRSTVTSFIDDSRRASQLLMANLGQAAELVASFKQVAVDQTSSKRRSFDVATTVREVVVTLQPTLRKTPFALEYELAPGLVMDSYPGPLGQVINNLVLNALIHGFEGRSSGTVRIEAQRRDDGHAVLVISDDGNGIAKTHLKKIFDPFFTTKFGKGGSGLGLHIVHNIVTGLLGGRIAVTSRAGEGTRFTVILPLVAPLPNRTRPDPEA